MQTDLAHYTTAGSKTDSAVTNITVAIIAARLRMRSGPEGLLCRIGFEVVVTVEIPACIDFKKLG